MGEWRPVSGDDGVQRRAARSAMGQLWWESVSVDEEWEDGAKTGRVRVVVVLEPLRGRVRRRVPDPDPTRPPPGT